MSTTLGDPFEDDFTYYYAPVDIEGRYMMFPDSPGSVDSLDVPIFLPQPAQGAFFDN